ncbi:murein hydrolase activator EnvC [Arsenophonus nasoniae]|uniref:murein hydrolase activator EnvC n=1 Tax=Arsenophonus nasoniae TaxID=638 RepID=UPI003879A30E
MNNTSRYGLVLILLALLKRVVVKPLLFVSLFFIWPSITIANPISDNKVKLKDLLSNIAEKERSVKQQQAERNHLLDQLKSQEKNIAAAGRALHETRKKLSQLAKEVTQLNENISRLQQQKQIHESLLAKQLDAAFRLGQQKGIELLFKGEQGQREERILAYYSYLNEARQQTIIKLQQTTTLLAEQKQQKQQKQLAQKKKLAKQDQEKKTLDSAQDARKKTLLSLESTLKADQKSLAVMKRNETLLRSKIAKAEREAKVRAQREAKEAARIRAKQRQAQQKGTTYRPTEDERALMARTGGLGRPVGQALWPVHGQILHHYGDSISDELRWKGMVINAAEGTEVKAISAGRVLLADWLQGYGLVVVIDHGQGDMSLYGYNQSALVNVGQQVRSGQPVALVGSSGGQQRSSLYFEIRRQGKTVNPQPWLGR